MSDTPALLSPERVAEIAKPLPYKQRMSLTQDALAGLPAHTNEAARFQGQHGYWVQGEAIFIPASNPGTAITFYRQRFNAGDIAASHNLATAAVGRMKAAAALDECRQKVTTELTDLRAELADCYGPDDLAITALDRAATRLGIDLTPDSLPSSK